MTAMSFRHRLLLGSAMLALFALLLWRGWDSLVLWAPAALQALAVFGGVTLLAGLAAAVAVRRRSRHAL